MNAAAHQEKEKIRRARERQEKREDKRSILKRLRAPLLRSFRG